MATINAITGDGYAMSAEHNNFPDARNDGGNAYDNNNLRDVAAILQVAISSKGTPAYLMRRAFFQFDTSGITATPASVTFKVRGHARNQLNIIAVKSTAANPVVAASFNDLAGASTALGNSDGSGAGTLAGVSGLTYSSAITSWDTSAYNNIALNSTALADMVSLDDFKICLMDYDYDYLDISPTPNFEQMTGLYWSEGVSESLHPYIDYTVAAAAADNAIFFGSNF